MPDFGLGPGVLHGAPAVSADAGLLADLVADAEAKGWEVVPAPPVDAGVACQAVGLRQGGWLFLVLAFGDALTPRDDNPGASMAVANEAHACCDGGRCAEPPAAPGLAPCPVEGFVPVLVWTNLPGGSGVASSWFHPDARDLVADERAWADPPDWEEHAARRRDGRGATP